MISVLRRFILTLIVFCLTGLGIILASNSKDFNPTTPVKLFTIDQPQELAWNALRSNARVRVFAYDQQQYQELKTLRPAIMTMAIPNLDGTEMEVELIENQVLSPDFVLSTPRARNIAYTPGLYYKGKIKGQDQSVVFISLFDDEVMGSLSAPGKGNLVIGSSKALRRNTFLLFDDSQIEPLKFECNTEELPTWKNELNEVQKGGFRSAAGCINVYFEAGSSVFASKGGATGAANFISGLFNGVSSLYAAEGISTAISELKVWTTSDPEPYGTGVGYGSTLGSSFNGNLAHYVRIVPGSSASGVGYLDVLCGSTPFAYSEVFSTNASYPAYSWNVNVLTHEMGHNLGSPHTHSCTWPGGPIDNCAPPEGNCSSGPTPPNNGGTIMSYCHQSGNPGISFSNGFGPLPGNLIRSSVSGASCLGSCGSAPPPPPATTPDLTISAVTLSPSTISSTAQAISLALTTSNLGANAGSSITRVYFSSDNSLSTGDENLIDINISSLTASSSQSAIVNISVPSGTTPGTYYFIVCADATGLITESSESNNCRSAAMTLTAPPATPQLFPDLEIGGIAGMPSAVTPNAAFNLSGTVTNSGLANAPATSMSIVFSIDNFYSANDISLYSGGISALNSKASTGFNASITIPASLPLKNYYIIVCVDPANAISETNEGNNCNTYAVAANVPTPDLSISTIVLNQNPVPTGNPFTVSFSSFNGGTAGSGGFNVGLYLSLTNATLEASDQLLGQTTINSLGANLNANGSIDVSTTIAPGTYNLLVCADNVNQVSELNENNNCAFVTLVVTNPLPDLTIDKFDVPVDFIAEKPQSIHIRIKNAGTKKSSTSTKGRLYLSTDGIADYRATLVRQFIIPALEVGASLDTTFEYTFNNNTPEGNIYFALCIDADNQVIEVDETNNCKSALTKIIVPLPDIVSFSAARYPNPVGRSTSIHYPLLISNIGRLDAPEVHTEYYVSYKPLLKSSGGFRLLVDTTREMAVGDTIRKNVLLKLPTALTAGSWYLNVCVDYDYKIKEVSEINNCQSIRLIIRNQMPDMAIDHFAFEDSVLYTSIPTPLNLGIKNLGELSANGITAKVFYHEPEGDTTIISQFLIDSLAPDQQLDTTIQTMIITASGNQAIVEVVLDQANTIKEALENNNSAVFSVTTRTPLPDLVTDILSISDTVFKSGSQYILTHSVSNLGLITCDSFSTKYFLQDRSSKKLIALGSLVNTNLSPLNIDTISFSFVLDQAISSDSYQLIVTCDPENKINESDESNNQTEVAIKVLQSLPDAAIEGLAIQDSLAKGDTVTADIRIINMGNWVMPSVQDPIILSLDSILSVDDLVVGHIQLEPLNPQEERQQSIQLNIPSDISSGPHYIILQVDQSNNITESDKTNNLAYFPVDILLDDADLDNVGIRLDKAGVEPGKALHVELMVSNIGESSILDYEVMFELKRNPNDSFSVVTFPLIKHSGMILPGQISELSTVLTIPDSLPSQTYYLMSCLDPRNKIAELSKDNNCGQILVKVETKNALTTKLKQDSPLFSNISLYPNPATQWLTIDGKVASTPTHQKAILEIKDYLGRTISRQSLPISDQLHYRMDIDRLSHGWYLVEITSTLGTWKQKFVKQ
ncbi:MAG: hypothetical protein IPF93_21335 [Saprospiraceae bacterium]|nr:hypothetical protein [Saprospiraceae bacterium]